MNRPRGQHYVTRAYLEGFVAPDEKQLYVYTRNKETVFRALPLNIGKINNYYSSRQPDGTYDDRVETAFAEKVEGPGLPVIKKLAAGRYNISRDARLRLSFLLAVQEYRVPWMREQTEAFTTGMLERFTTAMLAAPNKIEDAMLELKMSDEKSVKEAADKLRGEFRSGEITIAASPAASLNAIGYVAETLMNVYFRMGWEILETNLIPFITSDCPLHRYYLPIGNDVPYGGLLDKRVQVRFPLCANKMLVMRHDRKRLEIAESLHRRKRVRDATKLMSQSSEIKRVRVSEADVRQINAHTAAMAARFVFSPTAMTDGPELLRGECKNAKQFSRDYPGGLVEYGMDYPR